MTTLTPSFGSHPKYKFKVDFTAKVCSDINDYLLSIKNKVPCKSYKDLVYKKGDVFEAVLNVNNTDPTKVFGLANMMGYEVPLSVLDKVDDSTPITDIIEGTPEQKKASQTANDKQTKKMFIIPTVIILAVVWIYGLRKL